MLLNRVTALLALFSAVAVAAPINGFAFLFHSYFSTRLLIFEKIPL
jgi:hypothetical protein